MYMYVSTPIMNVGFDNWTDLEAPVDHYFLLTHQTLGKNICLSSQKFKF